MTPKQEIEMIAREIVKARDPIWSKGYLNDRATAEAILSAIRAEDRKVLENEMENEDAPIERDGRIVAMTRNRVLRRAITLLCGNREGGNG